MTAVSVTSYKNPEGNMDVPLSNLNFHRWRLSVENAETHATGLDNIVDYAVKNIDTTDEVGVTSVSAAGLFTFDVASGEIPIDLFVWTTK